MKEWGKRQGENLERDIDEDIELNEKARKGIHLINTHFHHSDWGNLENSALIRRSRVYSTRLYYQVVQDSVFKIGFLELQYTS